MKHLLGAEEKYERLERFRSVVLVPAIAQINRYSDLQLSFTLDRGGKRITRIKFHFKILNTTEIENRLHMYPSDYSIQLDADPDAGYKQMQATMDKLQEDNNTDSDSEYPAYPCK